MKKFAYRVWNSIKPLREYKVSFAIRCINGNEKTLADHSEYLYKAITVFAYSKRQAYKRAEIEVFKQIKVSRVGNRRL